MTALIDLLNEEKRILNYIDAYVSMLNYQESFVETLGSKGPQTEYTQYSIKAARLEIDKNIEKLEKHKRDLAECRSKILEYFQSITSHSVTLNINRKGE
jgi:hypothetical protein